MVVVDSGCDGCSVGFTIVASLRSEVSDGVEEDNDDDAVSMGSSFLTPPLVVGETKGLESCSSSTEAVGDLGAAGFGRDVGGGNDGPLRGVVDVPNGLTVGTTSFPLVFSGMIGDVCCFVCCCCFCCCGGGGCL